MNKKEQLRAIPAIERLLAAAEKNGLRTFPRPLLTDVFRQITDKARQDILQEKMTETTESAFLNAAAVQLQAAAKPALQRVINAAGVILHTNLGRAPLSFRAQKALNEIAGNYSNLEYEIVSGQRGTRYAHVQEAMQKLIGSEDVIVVNNNAAAVLLMLTTLAKGQEVIVSRGELVEIGGAFRVPDVMKESGAVLVEVGTTNKTHLQDYKAAITPRTAAILKVHTSNYRIVGFTAQPETAELAELAHSFALPLLEDLGSGTLLPLAAGSYQEPTVAEMIAKGCDVVTFSGDKLLGAGQAGIVAGKACYLSQMKKQPLLRALRIDKLSLAALAGTLLDYTVGDPWQDIPVLRMIAAQAPELEVQAQELLTALSKLITFGWKIALLTTNSQTGGGALPAIDLPSWAVAVSCRLFKADEFAAKLRCRETPIIVRIQAEQVLFDVRCLLAGDQAEIVAACQAIAAEEQLAAAMRAKL